jgi:hypothetical protein
MIDTYVLDDIAQGDRADRIKVILPQIDTDCVFGDAIMTAAKYNAVECMKLLVNKCDHMIRIPWALLIALESKHHAVLEVMLKVKYPNNRLDDAILFACSGLSSMKCIQLLIQAGAVLPQKGQTERHRENYRAALKSCRFES